MWNFMCISWLINWSKTSACFWFMNKARLWRWEWVGPTYHVRITTVTSTYPVCHVVIVMWRMTDYCDCWNHAVRCHNKLKQTSSRWLPCNLCHFDGDHFSRYGLRLSSATLHWSREQSRKNEEPRKWFVTEQVMLTSWYYSKIILDSICLLITRYSRISKPKTN